VSNSEAEFKLIVSLRISLKPFSQSRSGDPTSLASNAQIPRRLVMFDPSKTGMDFLIHSTILVEMMSMNHTLEYSLERGGCINQSRDQFGGKVKVKPHFPYVFLWLPGSPQS
jgi:hypothetical protein